MKHKLVSTRSSEILNFFRERGKDCFESWEAHGALPDSSAGAVRELLSDMVRRGLLMRLKKGLYQVVPYEQDAESFMPDWHLLAAPLTGGTDHYIGYYSALQIHSAITQPSLKEQIVVAKQIRPSIMKIKDVEFQFIYHNENHFFGFEKTWIDNFNRVNCSDLEKTIIDCLFKPEYAGGIVEVAKAIHMLSDKLDFDKLLKYVERFQSQAVIKRLGFLLETLEIDTKITARLNRSKTESFVLLDTELPKSGKTIGRWAIRQNLEPETIISAIYS